MKKHNLIILFLLSFSLTIFSQGLKVGLGGGYAYIDNNTFYSKEVAQNSIPSSLGLKHCLTFNSKLKYESSKFPVSFTWELIYISATNNIDYLGYYSLVQSGPSQIHLSASQKVYSLNVGLESPIFKGITTSYFALGILTNYFGKTKIERTPKPDLMFVKKEPIISDDFRIGLNIGLGVEFSFYKNFSIDVSAKYNFMNVGGESNFSENELEENFNTLSITAILFYEL